jgi:hypothetical protein
MLKNKKLDTSVTAEYTQENLLHFIEEAESLVEAKMGELNTPFNMPEIKLLSLFIPATDN